VYTKSNRLNKGTKTTVENLKKALVERKERIETGGRRPLGGNLAKDKGTVRDQKEMGLDRILAKSGSRRKKRGRVMPASEREVVPFFRLIRVGGTVQIAPPKELRSNKTGSLV